MRLLVRADASRQLGWGHVKRSLALAQALQRSGAEVQCLSAPTEVDVLALANQAGVPAALLPEPPRDAAHDAAMTAAFCHAARGAPHDAVVVDHYHLDARWHDAVRYATGAALVAIDDLADRALAVDLLIDHNPCADTAARYRPVLQRPAVVCGGLRHALLDACYVDHARHAFDPELRSIGIFMGGTDAENFSAFAWRALREDAGWAGPVEIASTRANPGLPVLQGLVANDPGVCLLLDQPNLADFHARHGLQVGAGGGACWERCCLGTPAIVLACADNQRASVPLLAAAGAAIGLDAVGQSGACRAELGSHVRRLIADPGQRLALHQKSLALVDGRGADRAAAAILSLIQP